MGQDLQARARRSTDYFSWSGKNSWLDRALAASQLYAEIGALIDAGWEWSIVAHSHGGNIVIEGLDVDHSEYGGLSGSVVLLGTPILKFKQPAFRAIRIFEGIRYVSNPYHEGPPFALRGREPRLGRVALGAIGSCALLVGLLALFTRLVVARPVESPFELTAIQAGVLFGVPLLSAAVYWSCQFVSVRVEALLYGFPVTRRSLTTPPARLLIINSRFDEAYSLLSSVLKMPTPWRSERAEFNSAFTKALANELWISDHQQYPWLALWPSFRRGLKAMTLAALVILVFHNSPGALRVVAQVAFAVLILRLLTKPGKMVAWLSLPWRIAELSIQASLAMARYALAFLARRRAWTTIQRVALGLQGSPHRLADVSIVREPDAAEFGGYFAYQDLSQEAETRALKRRAAALRSHWQSYTTLPQHQILDVAQVRDAVARLASNTDLVHASYYRDPAVLDMIAQHLTRTDEELVKLRRQAEAVRAARAEIPGSERLEVGEGE